MLIIKPKIEKYLEVIKVSSSNSANYLMNVFGRSFTIFFRIWIFSQLYSVTYNTVDAKLIGGLSVAGVVWVLMFAQSFQSASRPSISIRIDEEVRSGNLAYSLNKPYSYILFQFFTYFGKIIPLLGANLIIGVIAAVFFVGITKLNILGIFLAIILLLFGYTLNFLIGFCIGVLAFWVEDTSAFTWIYEKLQLVIGGVVLPLTILPGVVQKVAGYLPFSQLFYAPAKIIISFNWSDFFKSFSLQICWILIFAIFAQLLFKKALKQVTINGG